MDSWLGVEPRHLVTLATVHETGSFRGAAKRLGYVQSAVSQQISSLESQVGVRLIERTRGHAGVELTESGHVLLAHAERILSELDAAQADLQALRQGNRETLRVGVYQGLATGLLPRTLALLAERAPELRLDTREELSDADLFALVEHGELELAFAELPLEAGPFDSRPLLVDPLVLLVPAESDLAVGGKAPELAEIADQPVVSDPTWRMFALVGAEFRVAGLELKRSYTARTNAGAQAMVAAGLGVAVMPRLAADLADPAVQAVPLDHLLPVQTVVCFWHRDRHFGDNLNALLDVVAEAAEGLSSAAEEGGGFNSTRRFRRPGERAPRAANGQARRRRPAKQHQ
jgi:DNA-binding transcriptional LysR family regulator